MTTINRAQREPAFRCDIAVQAVIRGSQDLRVQGHTAASSANGVPSISIRVGRVLLVLESRDALLSWVQAITDAEALGPRVFGPDRQHWKIV